MKFFNKIKSFIVKIVVNIALFLDKIEVEWIDKILQLTEAIKKAMDNKIVQIGLELAKVDSEILNKFALYLPDIQERLSFLKVQWSDYDDIETPVKKIEWFIQSLVKSALPKEQRNQALLQIAMVLAEKMGIKIKGSFFSKQLSIETAYNITKKDNK